MTIKDDLKMRAIADVLDRLPANTTANQKTVVSEALDETLDRIFTQVAKRIRRSERTAADNRDEAINREAEVRIARQQVIGHRELRDRAQSHAAALADSLEELAVELDTEGQSALAARVRKALEVTGALQDASLEDGPVVEDVIPVSE